MSESPNDRILIGTTLEDVNDEGSVFSGSRDMFRDCFFDNADNSQIISWCIENDWYVKINGNAYSPKPDLKVTEFNEVIATVTLEVPILISHDADDINIDDISLQEVEETFLSQKNRYLGHICKEAFDIANIKSKGEVDG